MKKIGVILLLLLYGSSSIGMTLHFHYCCGKLKRIDFSAAPAATCSMDKHSALKSTSCCGHKQLSFQIRSDQSPSAVVHVPDQQPVVLPQQETAPGAEPLESKQLLPEVFAPPPLQKNLLHLYCTYRI